MQASQLYTPAQLSRLRSSIQTSETVLNEFRSNRMKALKEYLGANYSNQGSQAYNPVNLLWLYVTIYTRQLAARQPRVMIGTPFTEHKPSAANLELALDVLMRRIRLGDSIHRAVTEAMFGCGVMYVGLNASSTVEIGGVTHDVGQPFADPIFLDEAFFDMSARSQEQMQFIGHVWSMPRDQYYECGLFETGVELQKYEKRPTGFGGQEKSETLSTGGRSFVEDYKDFVRLRNIWLPMDGAKGVVITVEDQEDGMSDTGVLREVEWDGPERGPYHILRFSEVPGNFMPLPPVANVIDLHRLMNNMFRKIEDSARNAKTVLGYPAGADKDAERIMSSNHLEAIRMDNPDKVREFNFNSIDPRLLAFLVQTKDLSSWFMGNLDLLGGLSPSSSTVGQDKLLNESASKQLADMQRAVVDFTTDIIRDLAWYMWTDPLIHIPITKRVKNTSIEIPSSFSAQTRTGDFLDYNISIDPYSMQHSSPEMKLAAIQNALTNIILPMQPILESQGLTIDVRNIVKSVAKFSDTPELMEIVTALDAPIRPDAGPVGEAPSKSPVTTRNYVRENRPAPTRSNKDNAMMQTLLGGGVQPAEMEAALNA